MSENKNKTITVHHLARVEGHGNIHIHVREGKLVDAEWEVVETPRFFEAMLRGKHYSTASFITSRICGICSIAHSLTSLEATENAFNITIPDIARKVRFLAKHGETLQSHLLHIFFLAIPDFFKLPDVLPLVEKEPELVGFALNLKRIANDICDVTAGRTTHPVSFKVGGISKFPDKKRLQILKDELKAALPGFDGILQFYKSLEVPDFIRETEFVAIKGEINYPFIGRSMISSDGIEKPADDYLEMTNEIVEPHNTSKWCTLSRDSMAVGALARFNLNYRYLHDKAKEAADFLDLKPVNFNPFHGNTAQIVECVHVMHEMLVMIDELIDFEQKDDLYSEVKPVEGQGVGVVEAPRGILYHHYEFENQGRIKSANCIIPTTQNNLNIHLDLKELVKKFSSRGKADSELELLCSMLVRAYDPCISCSVH